MRSGDKNYKALVSRYTLEWALYKTLIIIIIIIIGVPPFYCFTLLSRPWQQFEECVVAADVWYKLPRATCTPEMGEG